MSFSGSKNPHNSCDSPTDDSSVSQDQGVAADEKSAAVENYGNSSNLDQRQFATTCWTVVVQAANHNTVEGQAALDSLCRQYWYPLYSFVRRKGFGREAAEDLTQSFFSFLLEKNNLGKADQARGRFRTFLLTALSNYLNNHHRQANTRKRSSEKWLSIDYNDGEQRYLKEPQTDLTPERIFDRTWALTLLESARQELSDHYQRSGKDQLFALLYPYMVREVEDQTYAQLATELSQSEATIKVTIHRMRERNRDLLRQKIAETVETSEQIDAEIHELFAVLGK